MDNRETVYNLIKYSLFEEEFEPSESIAWQDIYREMKDQAIAGLVGNWLSPSIVGDEKVYTTWTASVMRQVAFFYRILKEQKDLVSLLESEKIPFVILKGAAAALNYPTPEFRAMGDVDFLVKRSDFQFAKKLLIENGYTLTEDDEGVFHHAEYRKNGIVFELHNRVSGVESGSDCEYYCNFFENGLESAIKGKIEQFEFPMLDTLHNGMVLLLHMKHHLNGGLGLRQVIDWMMFADKFLDDETWEREFKPILEKVGLDKFAKTVTKMCQLKLGLKKDIHWCGDVSDKTCLGFLNFVMSMGNFGRKAAGQKNRPNGVISGFGSVVKLMQMNGELNWEACRKHKALKPFAWIWQAGLFVKIMGANACLKRGMRALRENVKS
jgi:hypothetical protein